MTAIAFTLRSPSEDATEVREFVAELLGSRLRDLEVSWRQKGVTREMAWLQRDEQGGSIIVFLEADDPARFYLELAISEEPFDRWYRQRVLDVYGIDLSQPPVGPPSELLADWNAS